MTSPNYLSITLNVRIQSDKKLLLVGWSEVGQAHQVVTGQYWRLWKWLWNSSGLRHIPYCVKDLCSNVMSIVQRWIKSNRFGPCNLQKHVWKGSHKSALYNITDGNSYIWGDIWPSAGIIAIFIPLRLMLYIQKLRIFLISIAYFEDIIITYSM